VGRPADGARLPPRQAQPLQHQGAAAAAAHGVGVCVFMWVVMWEGLADLLQGGCQRPGQMAAADVADSPAVRCPPRLRRLAVLPVQMSPRLLHPPFPRWPTHQKLSCWPPCWPPCRRPPPPPAVPPTCTIATPGWMPTWKPSSPPTAQSWAPPPASPTASVQTPPTLRCCPTLRPPTTI
jgi:hypothetical protein